jgi:hypothetical protein
MKSGTPNHESEQKKSIHMDEGVKRFVQKHKVEYETREQV